MIVFRTVLYTHQRQTNSIKEERSYNPVQLIQFGSQQHDVCRSIKQRAHLVADDFSPSHVITHVVVASEQRHCPAQSTFLSLGVLLGRRTLDADASEIKLHDIDHALAALLQPPEPSLGLFLRLRWCRQGGVQGVQNERT